MTKKKTTKSTTPVPSKKKAFDANAFLDANSVVRATKKGWQVEADPHIKAIVDVANQRRLAGEAIALRKLCEAIKNEFNPPISTNTMRSTILTYLGRCSW
jgi:hypothetical protein